MTTPEGRPAPQDAQAHGHAPDADTGIRAVAAALEAADATPAQVSRDPQGKLRSFGSGYVVARPAQGPIRVWNALDPFFDDQPTDGPADWARALTAAGFTVTDTTEQGLNVAETGGARAAAHQLPPAPGAGKPQGPLPKVAPAELRVLSSGITRADGALVLGKLPTLAKLHKKGLVTSDRWKVSDYGDSGPLGSAAGPLDFKLTDTGRAVVFEHTAKEAAERLAEQGTPVGAAATHTNTGEPVEIAAAVMADVMNIRLAPYAITPGGEYIHASQLAPRTA